MYITGENVILKGFWIFYETVIPVIRRNIYWNQYRFPERRGLSAFQPYSGLSLVDYLDVSLGVGWAALINSVTSKIWSSKRTHIGKYLIWITMSTSPGSGGRKKQRRYIFCSDIKRYISGWEFSFPEKQNVLSKSYPDISEWCGIQTLPAHFNVFDSKAE